MTDEELILRAQNGDEDALNTLLKKYKSLINQISRSYFLIGGDVEDIIQEGMIGLYKAIKNYTTKKNASFKTFATTCIKNQIQTAIKVASSEKNKVLSSALSLTEEADDEDEESTGDVLVPSPLPPPDDLIIEKEEFNQTYDKIKKILSPLEIKVLNYYLQGFSYNEISEKSNLNKKSIDNALSRIKTKLAFLKDKNKE